MSLGLLSISLAILKFIIIIGCFRLFLHDSPSHPYPYGRKSVLPISVFPDRKSYVLPGVFDNFCMLQLPTSNPFEYLNLTVFFLNRKSYIYQVLSVAFNYFYKLPLPTTTSMDVGLCYPRSVFSFRSKNLFIPI